MTVSICRRALLYLGIAWSNISNFKMIDLLFYNWPSVILGSGNAPASNKSLPEPHIIQIINVLKHLQASMCQCHHNAIACWLPGADIGFHFQLYLSTIHADMIVSAHTIVYLVNNQLVVPWAHSVAMETTITWHLMDVESEWLRYIEDRL